jgi:hypothetical protein
MKRQWSVEELSEHWMLTTAEFGALGNKTGATRLGFAVLLKYIQYDGRFPHARQDVPLAVVAFVADHVKVAPDAWSAYRLDSRTAKYHRAHIRQWLAFRAATAHDGKTLTDWLVDEVVPTEQRPEHVKERLLQHCRAVQIEPPSEGRIQRFIDSALRQHETRLYARTLAQLAPPVRAALDGLLSAPDAEAAEAAEAAETAGTAGSGAAHPQQDATAWMPQTVQVLRTDPGRVGLQTFLREVAKLRRIRALGLPVNLFAGVAPTIVHSYRQRAEAEKPSALLAHPVERRATLLAALLVEREQEIIDNLVELLIHLMHRVVARAEKKVEAA